VTLDERTYEEVGMIRRGEREETRPDHESWYQEQSTRRDKMRGDDEKERKEVDEDKAKEKEKKEKEN